MLLLKTTQGGCLRLLLLCAIGLFAVVRPSLAGTPRSRSGGSRSESNSSGGSAQASGAEGQRLLLSELQPHGKKAGKGAEDPNDYLNVVSPGSSSRSDRKQACSEMPFEKLAPEKQLEVRELIKNYSFYRRLPTVEMEVDHRTYLFLIGNPDVTVAIWRAMKISKVELWETERDKYESNTNDGTTGTVEVLHRGSDKHLVLCDGEYKSPLMSRPIAARSLVLLQTRYSKDANGKHFVTHRADLFVHFPSGTVDTAAKIFSKLTVSMTDRSFSEISVFLRIMSVAMARRPDWVEGISRNMDGVSEERRQQLVTLAARVYADVQKQPIHGQSGETSASASGSEGVGAHRVSAQNRGGQRQ